MAKFKADVPNDLIKQFEMLEKNTDKMLGAMTQAGAKVVYENIKNNVPSAFNNSDIMNCLIITKTYKTPTDDGINNKVAFYGHFINMQGKRVPAPLVCNIFEYGSSKRNFPIKKFLKKSFNGTQITVAMRKEQDKYLPKD